MSRKNRNRLEIMTDIMEACIHGSKKTRIMYSANLSYELTKKYVADMLNAGLLMKREVEEGEMYFLTEKGRNVLDKLKKYKSLRQELHKLNDELRGLHKLNDELRGLHKLNDELRGNLRR